MISPGPSSALQSFWVRANHRTKREQPPAVVSLGFIRFESIWPLEEGLLGLRAGPNRRLDYTSQKPSRRGRVLCWGNGDSFREAAVEGGRGEQVRGTLANSY